MNPEAELQAAHTEVQRKLGRNLLMFQQAEQLLKLLLTLGHLRPSPEKPATCNDPAALWSKQTLARVKAGLPVRQRDPVTRFDPQSQGTTMTFTFDDPRSHLKQRRADIDMLAAEREDLIHHFLFRLCPDSLQSCHEVSAHLDAQQGKALPVIQQLKDDCQSAREMMAELITLLMADEDLQEKRVDPIRKCPLITNLAAIAAENPDPGAWTPLKSAIDRLQDFPSEKIGELVAQFRRKSLRNLLDASQLFELKEELFGTGGHRRILYRLKAGSRSKFRV